MSRRRELYDIAEGKHTAINPVMLLMANLPVAMLANDYIRELTGICSAVLLEQYQEQKAELTMYDITANI